MLAPRSPSRTRTPLQWWMPPGQSAPHTRPRSARKDATCVNPELASIIRSSSTLPAQTPLSGHIEHIQDRKASELAATLRVAAVRLQHDALV